VISNNRERWTEARRDSVAEYVALLLSVSAVKEDIGQNPLKAVTADHALLEHGTQTLRVDEAGLSGLAYGNSRRYAIYFELSRLREAQ
jgi:hypothetical protein